MTNKLFYLDGDNGTISVNGTRKVTLGKFQYIINQVSDTFICKKEKEKGYTVISYNFIISLKLRFLDIMKFIIHAKIMKI